MNSTRQIGGTRSSRRPRVAALGLFHESNTFATGRAGYEQFEECGIYRGSEVTTTFRGSEATMAGYLEAGERCGFDLVPLAFAQANPMGPMSRDAFTRLTGEFLAQLRDEGPWDAVLLAQHGAAVAEGAPDADGEFISLVRATIGPHTPLGVTLDLHANVSPRMIEASTITVLYRTNPHLDARLRALECAELVAATLRGDVRPVQALEKPPLAVNILRQATTSEPMASLMAELQAVLNVPGVLSASLAEGYPYADVEEMGMACLVIADGDPEVAHEASVRLATTVWNAREALQGAAVPVEEAVARALAARNGPVLLLDVGDNIGGGSPGDSTTILHAARRAGLADYLETICDASAAAACAEAGVGGRVGIDVGGRMARHSPPCSVSGTVVAVTNGRFEDTTPLHGGFRHFNTGLTAALQTDEGQTLVLTSLPVIDVSVRRHHALGLEPEQMRVIVAKGVHSPIPGYGPIATELICVDTPGATCADLTSLDYVHRPRPLYPLDPDALYL